MYMFCLTSLAESLGGMYCRIDSVMSSALDRDGR